MLHVKEHAAVPATDIYADLTELTHSVASKLLSTLRSTVEDEGFAHVALTGGGPGIGVLKAVAEHLASEEGSRTAPDWSRVHIWWGDERLLPGGESDRNDQQAREALLDALVAHHGLPEENIHAMPTSEDAANPEAGAEMYAQQLQAHAPAGGSNGLALPKLAVHLLGVGPDGHINSLFPHKDALHVTGQAVTSEDDAPAELGPPMRVTLTFDAIHSAERVWLVTAGDSKAEAVSKAFDEDTPVEEIPSKNARGIGETVWHLDRAAASRL
ncbi:6-phosphogluconolactonase [Nesterenkonia sp. NBAIMH1]|uniref:6-phosphogluconolactonase n=1 Tax=Nesterenkonia sp. NBAIMH1 TaxID=2600320 RepID=UPI0011B5A574|nr:6-phosphogluconolactonase [Nesterenkonia sp. NBAIMH1]